MDKAEEWLALGGVRSPILFNTYINDQPIHDGTRNFIYADDLCITAQYSSFTKVETTIGDALEELAQYYRSNSLRANPDKTQGAHAQYKDEGGHPQQSTKKVVQFEMGSIRTTVLALCYYVAEYAAPVWARSSHAQKLNPELNSACRAVTGCLKPTNVEDLYLLAGIAPPDIRRDVCARVEKTKQETNEAHSLYGQNPAERRLKSRNCLTAWCEAC